MAMVKNEPSCNITYSVCGLGSLRLHMDVLMKSPHCILTRACGEETHHCLFSEQEKKKKNIPLGQDPKSSFTISLEG